MHSSRRAGGPLLVLLLAAMAVAPSPALAMRGSGELAPRLAKLAAPSLRDASAHLQAKEVGLVAAGPGSLIRDGKRVLIDVRFEDGALAALDELRAAGARTLDASRRYQAVTVAAKPSQLHAIAAVPDVAGVSPILAPVTASTCPSGAVVSEGDSQLLAGVARANFGVDGDGVTVGILSDSFDQATEAADGSGEIATHAAEDVESGDLPGVSNDCPEQATPVDELSKINNASEASDEGRAMTQIVHDLAPGANLAFASAFNGEMAFANNIRALANAGKANVIADDVFYFEEPFFQDGPIAVAVNEVAADGVTYFSAAGNDNLIDGEGNDIASWETPEYRDTGSCPPAVQAIPAANGSHCLDFNPGSQIDKTFGIRVEPGETLTVDLQWDEPWNGVGADLDAYLLSASGALLAQSQEDNVEITQTPVEVLQWTNESTGTRTVQLAVNRFSDESQSPRVKFVLIQNGGGVSATEYPRSSGEDVVGPTIFGHSGAAGAISVGAVPFNSKSKPEVYSSRGPVVHDFGPVEGTSAAAPLPTSETLSKPDLVATDCGKTTFFSGFFSGFWRFCGTSAAAPHAAAVAALMLEAEAAAEPEEVRAALLGSAVPVGAFGPCAVGAGLVEAVGAVEEVIAATGSAGPVCEPPKSEVDPEEAAAAGDWGSEGGSTPGSRGVTPQPPIVNPPPPEPPKPAPRTFFLQRPGKVITTSHQRARAVFLFGSNEAGVSFACRIDGGLFRPCSARLVRRFPSGWHTIKVAAYNGSGVGDNSPASYRFKIKRVR